jgi:hypothetical protein
MEFRKSPTFRSNLSHPSPGPKRKPRKKPSRSRQEAELSTPDSAGVLLGLLFDPGDGSDVFLRNARPYNPVFIQLMKEHNSHNFDMFST